MAIGHAVPSVNRQGLCAICVLCFLLVAQVVSGTDHRVRRISGYLPEAGELAAFLATLQDSSASGLVPAMQGSSYSTTYVSAMAAIVFIDQGELERARRVLDLFAARQDPCPSPAWPGPECACTGGFQQHRDASSGAPLEPADPASNDFWIGDNAWLLLAFKHYRRATGDDHYDSTICRLRDWLLCLHGLTPQPGIYAGYRKDGTLKDEKHAEGSIDTYGALEGLGSDTARQSIKQWIDAEVWVAGEDGLEVGPASRPGPRNLPLDNASWGYLALGDEYRQALGHAEALLARGQDRYLIESFDRPVDSYWQAEGWSGDPSISVDLENAGEGPFRTMSITYSWTSPAAWLRVFRSHQVRLKVSSSFRYELWVRGDGSGNQLEIKLGTSSGDVFIHSRPLDHSTWQRIEVSYSDLEDFFSSQQSDLDDNPITLIELAINNASNQVADRRQIEIGPIRYLDPGSPARPPVSGFAAFESDTAMLWPEGTAQMAVAYCVAGDYPRWNRLLRDLAEVTVPTPAGIGLPEVVGGAVNQAEAISVASAWYALALRCADPFAPSPSAEPEAVSCGP